MTEKILVAVHQPTYLPWLGFFHKLRQSDVFVILDDAQIQKTRSSWVNRTQILHSGKSKWLTIPISRPSGVQQIRSATIVGEGTWRKSHRGILHEAYKKAPHYQSLRSFLECAYEYQGDSLLHFNLHSIQAVLEVLGLWNERKIVLASSFDVRSQGTSRLIELVKRVGGNSYLCGGGSAGYLDQELFLRSRLDLVFQEFKEPPRPQYGANKFVGGLSILDSLLNVGVEQTYSYLQ